MSILRSVTALLLSALVGAVVLVGAPTASADPYQPQPRPECIVKVHPTEPGERIRIVVGARLNSSEQPSGTITVRLLRGGVEVWSKTVHTNGEVKRIVGPVVPRGSYVVTSTFIPDNGADSRGCQGRQPFNVDRDDDGDDGDDDGDGDDGNGGLLPDTGGPQLLWLLLGVTLVGGGAAAVTYARRRATAPVAVLQQHA